MTKKDYVAIADAIKEAGGNGGDQLTLNMVSEKLCEAFHTENPKFSRETFLKAAGIGGALSRGAAVNVAGAGAVNLASKQLSSGF